MDFIITGVPRSGTSILRRVIDSSSKIVCFHEIAFYYINDKHFNLHVNKFKGRNYTKELGKHYFDLLISSVSKQDFLNRIRAIYNPSFIGDKCPLSFAKLIDFIKTGIPTIIIVRNPINCYVSNYLLYQENSGWIQYCDLPFIDRLINLFYDMFYLLSLKNVVPIRYELACNNKGYLVDVLSRFFNGIDDFDVSLLDSPKTYEYNIVEQCGVPEQIFNYARLMGYIE